MGWCLVMQDATALRLHCVQRLFHTAVHILMYFLSHILQLSVDAAQHLQVKRA